MFTTPGSVRTIDDAARLMRLMALATKRGDQTTRLILEARVVNAINRFGYTAIAIAAGWTR